jgi:hypothetical protein
MSLGRLTPQLAAARRACQSMPELPVGSLLTMLLLLPIRCYLCENPPQLRSQSCKLVSGKMTGWDGHGVVGRIVWVIKHDACEYTRLSIPRNNVQVNVPVLILQKGIVEVVGPESYSQHLCCLRQLVVQVCPLSR